MEGRGLFSSFSTGGCGHTVIRGRYSPRHGHAGGSSLKPEIKELIAEFKPGYKLGQHRGSGKIEILDPMGKPARLPSGKPVTFPETPRTDGHSLKQTRGNLIRAGVIERGARGKGSGGGQSTKSGGRSGSFKTGVRTLPSREPPDLPKQLEYQLRSAAVDLLKAGHDPARLVELLAQACREIDRENAEKEKDAHQQRSA